MSDNSRKNVGYVVGKTRTVHIIRLPHSNVPMARAICGTKPPSNEWKRSVEPTGDAANFLCVRCKVGYRYGWGNAPLPGESGS